MLTLRKYTQPKATTVYIALSQGFYATINTKNHDWVSRYKWHVRHARGCHYAVRVVRSGGREFLVSMHRMLMHTRKADVVHHIDHNGLNNTEENMVNMSREQHTEIHRFT